MADFHGLIMRLRLLLLLGFLLSFAACTAMAETIPATPTTVVVSDLQYSWPCHSGTCGGSYSTRTATPEEQSAAIIAYQSSIGRCITLSNPQYPTASAHTYTQTTRQTTCSGTVLSSGTIQSTRSSTCPTGSTWNGSDCVRTAYTCPATGGWTLEGQSCTRNDCAPKAGTDASDQGYFTGGIATTACISGCTANIQISEGVDVILRVVNGVDTFYTRAKYVYPESTSSCTSNTPLALGPLPASTCGANQTGGYINGTYMCVDNTTQEPVPTSPNKTETETTDKTTETNPDGSSTTTETTTNSDGLTTTTTTTTSADGTTSTSTSTSSGPPKNEISDYCLANPTAAVCAKSEASGGGDCSNAPTCQGDAIQCAILRQQWENRCSSKSIEDALGKGSQQAEALAQVGTDSMIGNPADLTSITETLDVSGQISQQKFLAGGCIADETISLPYGQSLTIPFSSLCPYLEIFGNIMVIVAMLAAARIVGVT